jgi:hypothetical protein
MPYHDSRQIKPRVFFVCGEIAMVRLQITLDQIEADVLISWATAELRDPREQIHLVLRQELERRGLLQAELASLTDANRTGSKPEQGKRYADS